jgi:integrase
MTVTPTSPAVSQQAAVDAALLILERMGLSPDDLAAATTGDDPELDTLILRLHTETACRRGGVLALRPADLDPEQCLVLLREKGETVRWQPVSPTLMAALVQHAEERHAPPAERLLRYRDGRGPRSPGRSAPLLTVGHFSASPVTSTQCPLR